MRLNFQEDSIAFKPQADFKMYSKQFHYFRRQNSRTLFPDLNLAIYFRNS